MIERSEKLLGHVRECMDDLEAWDFTCREITSGMIVVAIERLADEDGPAVLDTLVRARPGGSWDL